MSINLRYPLKLLDTVCNLVVRPVKIKNLGISTSINEGPDVNLSLS
jgi:hypothetical protein